MKYLVLISALLLTSCSASKKAERTARKVKAACDLCPVSSKVKEVIKFIPKTDTTYITKEGEVIVLESPCSELCDNLGNIKRFSRKRRRNGLVTTLKTVEGKLIAECSADSLQAIIDGFEKETIITEVIKEEPPVVKPNWVERMKIKFSGFLLWYFIITVTLVTGRLAIKRFKLF